MKIAILGSGAIGGSLGKLWAMAGHQVTFTSRHPENLESLVKQSGKNAKATSVGGVAAGSDVVLLATPFTNRESAIKEAGSFDGKILIDATNPYLPKGAGLALGVGETAAETLAKLLPTAKIVKAFNHLPAQIIADHPRSGPSQIGAYYAGDFNDANDTVRDLIAEIGFQPLFVGPLKSVYDFEPRGALYNKPAPYREAEAMLEKVQAK